jgi:pentatricopeptide repeat protein
VKDIVAGQEIHLDVAETGLEEDPFVANALIDMYAKCGLLCDARDVLDEMPERAWPFSRSIAVLGKNAGRGSSSS